jgi:hypothetical protein
MFLRCNVAWERLLFLWRRERAINERAKVIARMVMLIVHSLQTKSYDEFVDRFSNPDSEPSPPERLRRQLFFRMRMSPTCWYDARADYPADGSPFFHIGGGGDDWGVRISGDAIPDHPIGVDFHSQTKSEAGRDAHAIVHALRELPGWSHTSVVELANFAARRRASLEPGSPPRIELEMTMAVGGVEQQSNPLVYEDDQRGDSIGRDIQRKKAERLERALKAAIDEGERELKLLEEKRAKLNNGAKIGELPNVTTLQPTHVSLSAPNLPPRHASLPALSGS